MCDTCDDSRFELIKKYKQRLLDATNIDDSPEEMAVIDNILFRFWQMGWLAKLELFGNSEQLNDTISRAAVVDEIDGVDWYHINKNGEMVHGANDAEHQAWYKADDIFAAIERVPSAQPVEDASAMCGECDAWNQYKNYPHPGWIPCSERLPEEEKAYLVTFANEKVGMSSWHKDTFNRGFNRGFDAYLTGVTEDGECEYFGVVAWMKKPEPWKGGPDEH